jgi:hypothetical protein
MSEGKGAQSVSVGIDYYRIKWLTHLNKTVRDRLRKLALCYTKGRTDADKDGRQVASDLCLFCRRQTTTSDLRSRRNANIGLLFFVQPAKAAECCYFLTHLAG